MSSSTEFEKIAIPGCPVTKPKTDPFSTHKALEWHGRKDVRIVERPRPVITEPGDVIVRTTATTICGSDLHLYQHEFSGLAVGDVLGHEGVGIVADVGSDVNSVKVGDRVVISAVIACGKCEYCQRTDFSYCNVTNPSKMMEETYGARISGIFGYSHLLGGYDGMQAEYIRVPYADNNVLKLSPKIADDKALLLSDIACTAWMANEYGKVEKGSTVAIWGMGPVGLLAAMWAKWRGASRIIAIDPIPYRLDIAKKFVGAEVINGSEGNVKETILKMIPGGPTSCLDCAGFRFPKSLSHKFQRMMRLETDAPDVLEEAIYVCKKGGNLAVIGDYYMTANKFPIGPLMEKGIVMHGSQVHVQKYWHKILEIFEKGEVDPTFVYTHRLPFSKVVEGYRMFDKKEDGVEKILLVPSANFSS
jgi:threonine dehydrogenase-like Zn-dependent dehydrogenase